MNRRTTRLIFALILAVFCCAVGDVPSAQAAKIEAKKGKRYLLTKQHGPWMIMVASFHNTAPDGQVVGKSPEQAADELVYELRRKNIPAYTYFLEGIDGTVPTVDRLGRPQERTYQSQYDQVCVLAGNYSGTSDELARKTLAFIKRYNPKCLQDGVLFRPTPGRPTPLAVAFLTVNPLLSPEELAQRKRDPLLKKLNSGQRFSLLENKGEYSLAIATFTGKSVAQLNHSSSAQQFSVDDDLDRAADNAWQLAVALRETENVEAWVWHDRHRSIVTVGSFDSPQDPGIAAYKQRFGAGLKQDEKTQQPVLQVSYLALDERGNKINPQRAGNLTGGRLWAFDPNPQLIPVPRLR